MANKKWEYMYFLMFDTGPNGDRLEWMSLDSFCGAAGKGQKIKRYESIAEAGLDGWEIVQVLDSDDTEIIFKREVESTQDPFTEAQNKYI